MDMIRSHKNQNHDGTAVSASRPKFIGAFLFASGLSIFLTVAMTGFTVAMAMIWPG